MYYLARIEESGISIWVRESAWGFFTALTFHSLSLAVVVGVSVAISLRFLGVANRVPLNLLRKFLPVIKLALLVVIVSGLFLLLAYPAKALTNSVFYLKLAAVISAVLITWRLVKIPTWDDQSRYENVTNKETRLATLALALWICGVSTGRFLAYTNSIMLASSFY